MFTNSVVGRCVTCVCVTGAMIGLSPRARAQEADAPTEPKQRGAIEKRAAIEVTRVAYTHTAFGAAALTIGGAGFGEATGGFQGPERPHFGGGVRVWGSPIDRVTILADGERREVKDEF